MADDQRGAEIVKEARRFIEAARSRAEATLREAEQRAATVLEEANQEAATILARARREAKAMRAEADRVRSELDKEREQLMQRVGALAREFAEMTEQLRAGLTVEAQPEPAPGEGGTAAKLDEAKAQTPEASTGGGTPTAGPEAQRPAIRVRRPGERG